MRHKKGKVTSVNNSLGTGLHSESASLFGEKKKKSTLKAKLTSVLVVDLSTRRFQMADMLHKTLFLARVRRESDSDRQSWEACALLLNSPIFWRKEKGVRRKAMSKHRLL